MGNKSNKIEIFLSYSSKDRKRVALFKTLLMALDKEDTIKYHDYSEGSELYESSTYSKILSQINSCNVFISFLSKNYLNSTLCCWESGIAAQKNILISKKRSLSCNCNIIKSNFSFIGINCYSENNLELFHSTDNVYNFSNDGIISKYGILNRIKNDTGLIFNEYPDNIEDNPQKELENLILDRVIKNCELDRNSEKIKILTE